jgi:hypothetical protein
MYEPTRLAAEHLADAYSQIVPLRLRSAKSPQTTSEGSVEVSMPIDQEKRS